MEISKGVVLVPKLVPAIRGGESCGSFTSGARHGEPRHYFWVDVQKWAPVATIPFLDGFG